MDSMTIIESKLDDLMTAYRELGIELQAMEETINSLSSEVVDIQDYQGLKDDIADYLIAVQTDDEDAQAAMLKHLMGYFARDERENIAKEIEKGDRQ